MDWKLTRFSAGPVDERRMLQVAVLLACIVPLMAGLAGVLVGPHMANPMDGAANTAFSVQLDSHFRYLSGVLLGVGIAFAILVPRIERQAARFRVLTLVVVIGGAARLFGYMTEGWPGLGMTLALVIELGVTPLLCLWQGRVARLFEGYEKDRMRVVLH